MIEIRDLKKTYNGVTVVDIPYLSIAAGESIGLVGNNGAGKTTLFRIILDLIRKDSGEVISKNYNVSETDDWKDYTGSYLDEGFLIDYLTPEEYFYYIGSLYQISRSDIDLKLQAYREFFNDEILGKKKYIRDLSKGNQTKVGVVACLIQQPEIILLDEPFANIDPSTQIRLKSILKQIERDSKCTTVVSSHDLNHVTEVSQRILLMEKGKIIKDIQTDSNTLGELEKYFSVQRSESFKSTETS
ncbi:ABC transporter ATP-binding protein [Arcticibacter sp.]|jgi:ABC-2 type transport system ATP-binding protein|uniref:ABC transporter ATP-binding protein n=1 Tax=Arcticibacter sp. TaxID=1872630 RepID=UPI00388E68ED